MDDLSDGAGLQQGVCMVQSKRYKNPQILLMLLGHNSLAFIMLIMLIPSGQSGGLEQLNRPEDWHGCLI